MAEKIPAKLKDAQIAPFARRAAQLENFRPIVTYWLRFYIVQKIISTNLHTADAECTSYTTDLMEKLEQTKAEHPSEDALLDEVAAYAYCEQFALQTFTKADREMAANKVTKNTADTFLAASTFLEMLTIWRKEPEPEIKSKLRFAKYHAARILKAIRLGEDPNASNPVHEPPPAAVSPSALDPNDPEVQSINQSIEKPPAPSSYQPYVESAPNTSAQPSPTFSAAKVSPPPNLPSAPTGYSSHRDVSPISQPAGSRQGSVDSAGGGYFPRVNVPTFTADAAAPSLPTAPSIYDEPMTDPFESSTLPTGSDIPQAPQVPDPQNFYQSATTTAPLPSSQQPHPPQNIFQQSPPQPGFASPPSQHHFPAQTAPPPFQPPPATNHGFAPQPPQLTQPAFQQHSNPAPTATGVLHQGPFKTDEESVMEAQKHAKWAISALNFEDVNTAVKELRVALRALGAS